MGEVKIFCDGTELKGVKNGKAVFVVVVCVLFPFSFAKCMTLFSL